MKEVALVTVIEEEMVDAKIRRRVFLFQVCVL